MVRPRVASCCFTACLSAISFFLATELLGQDEAERFGRIENGGTPIEADCRLVLTADLSIGALDTPESEVFATIVSYAIGPESQIFILDADSRLVSAFDERGEFLTHFGGRGRGPGELEGPYRIAANKTVVVYDRGLGRIARFSLEGEHIATHVLPVVTFATPFLLELDDGRILITGMAPGSEHGDAVIYELSANASIIQAFGHVPPLADSASFRHLATGPAAVDEQGRVWFTPVSAYEIHRYSSSGQLELILTREHDLAFDPGPFLIREQIDAQTSHVRFDSDRAFSVYLHVDTHGYLWHFITDNPNERTVIDIFSPDGVFLQSHELPREAGPKKRDQKGRFYNLTLVNGYPQLIRYRGELKPMGGSQDKCTDLLSQSP